jgi:hypothetical protein
MKNYRVSMRFSRLPDSSLNLFASSTVVGMTGNPAFPAPLIPLSEVSSLQTIFGNACVASNTGGTLSTAIKNKCRAALLSALRSQANYVQGVTRHDLSQLLSSGFNAANLNRAQTQLAAPLILKIMNERTTELALGVRAVANARSYQVQIQAGNGQWQEAGIFSQARRIVLANLTPGTVYNIRIRATGGSTGFSAWSDPKSRMSL